MVPNAESLRGYYVDASIEEPRGIRLVGRGDMVGLEAVDLDGLGIQLQTLLLIREELLNILALIALQLDHLSHFSVNDDGAIASELLLDDLEDLLLVELLGKTLDSG